MLHLLLQNQLNNNISNTVNSNIISGKVNGALNAGEALTVRVKLPEGYFVGAHFKLNIMKDYRL